MAEERESFEKFLTQKLGRKARVVVPQSAAVILQGLQNSQIDVAFIGSVDMIEAQKAGSAEILAAVSFNGKTSYESYWLTLKDKTYQSIQDLKGKPVAFASRTSTSGLIIPWDAMIRAEFIKRGQRPEVFFGEKNVLYGSGYMSAVEMLFQGRAEAAAVSDYVFNTDNYLKPEQKAKLRILQRQGPVPTHVLAIRKSLGAEAKKLLSQLVGELNQKENESLRNKLFNSDLVPVDAEKHLAPTKAALERTEIRLN
jgi:phosphonate transport system substrate-binding protein